MLNLLRQLFISDIYRLTPVPVLEDDEMELTAKEIIRMREQDS